jgi:hypothetical protein
MANSSSDPLTHVRSPFKRHWRLEKTNLFLPLSESIKTLPMGVSWQKFLDLLVPLLFLICLFHSLGSAFFFNLAKLSKSQHIL